MIQIEVLRNVADWEFYQATWDQLAEHNFMMQSPWLRSWWDGFGAGRELYILHAKVGIQSEDGDQSIGFLPLCRSYSPIYGWQLEFLGSDRACSDNLSMLVRPNLEARCAEAFADYLSLSTDWDRLNLDGIQQSNPLNHFLGQSLESRRIGILDKSGPSCWKTNIEGGWQPFLASLSKRARRLLRKQDENYLCNGRATVRQPRSLEDALEMTETIADLHQARNQAVDRDGAFSCKPFRSFLRSVVERHWRNETLFVSMLNQDGRDVAGCIGIWTNDSLAIYLCGMLPDAGDHRPGWTLNIANVKIAIERGAEYIDFLRGDEFYKERLGATPTVQSRWIAAAPRLIPRIRHAAYQATTWLRDKYQCRTAAVEVDTEAATS